ncbi:Sporulation lipoprotein YhcN/YlaJ (Spore_YhcN_YlaJ) [Gracilibacillus ureilyticus]|uniref:Sporulation lipoprotein YhcN/YlaJ (Spore_YhcN_YlaJ) n=1 Tax=Gracilibacillus ureilyticus TaxID=531814 RepID=A0A1H9TM46_9BACI|nr:hypothetical protein [Gracilibacillus ureilyticus]SER98202.1 Sporulation lipoprotein YhcN/YlaJ (Spore_YhcN_YlaJ) [Gracilibacillus ureilyticus]
MNLKAFLFTTIVFFSILTGCNAENNESNGTSTSQPKQISTETNSTFSLPSVAQEVMDEQENKMVKYRAVQTKKDLFIAVQLTSINQMNEQDIAKKIQKKIKKKMKDKEVNVTSDTKFLMELEKLQRKEKIDQKEIEKKVKDMKKLLKEQT